MLKIAVLFMCIFVYQFFNNQLRLHQLNKHKQKLLQWLHDNNSQPDLLQDRMQIKKLVENAGITNTYIITDEIAIGGIRTAKVNVLDRYPPPDTRYTLVLMESLEAAAGVYKQRIRDAINPLCWIEFIVFLPKNAFSYVGLDGDSVTAKVIQLIWWFLFPLTLMFREEFYSVISQFINLP